MYASAPREGMIRQATRQPGTFVIEGRIAHHVNESIAFNSVSTHNIVHVDRIVGQRLSHLRPFLHESWFNIDSISRKLIAIYAAVRCQFKKRT